MRRACSSRGVAVLIKQDSRRPEQVMEAEYCSWKATTVSVATVSSSPRQ